MCPIKLCIILVKQPACAHFGDDWKSGLIERRLSFCRIRIRRARSFASSVYAPSARLHARVRALGRCVRDHSSLSRGHRRCAHEPTYSRSRRVVISFVSFVSDVDTTCANADTSRTSSGVRSETARRTSTVYSSCTISSHRRRRRLVPRGRWFSRSSVWTSDTESIDDERRDGTNERTNERTNDGARTSRPKTGPRAVDRARRTTRARRTRLETSRRSPTNVPRGTLHVTRVITRGCLRTGTFASHDS